MGKQHHSKRRVIGTLAAGTVSLGVLGASLVAPTVATADPGVDVPGQDQPIPVPAGSETAPDPNAQEFDVDHPEDAVALVPQDEADGVIKSQSETKSGKKVVKVRPSLSPNSSQRVGVAQVITLRFPMSINRKANVADAIKVRGFKKGKKGKNKKVALPGGKWGWVGSRTAVYRPKKFWPGETKLRFEVDLKGVTMAKTKQEEYVGSGDASFVQNIKTRRSFVLRVSNKNKRISAYRNGKHVRSFGVSLGKKGYETRSGVKVLTGIKYRSLRMRGTDRITGETWDVVSPWSIPLTTNGEFIHGAPWARYRIGRANGSHGCTNMNAEDARWIYKRVKEGDPVVTKGTGRSMPRSLSYPQGEYWTYSWSEWKKLAA
ncbi:MAG: L,D-transpeptidase [Actinomycetia bacterium]|nr:L,D-transpeptidase [Actinomycetes bacterium]